MGLTCCTPPSSLLYIPFVCTPCKAALFSSIKSLYKLMTLEHFRTFKTRGLNIPETPGYKQFGNERPVTSKCRCGFKISQWGEVSQLVGSRSAGPWLGMGRLYTSEHLPEWGMVFACFVISPKSRDLNSNKLYQWS